MKSEEQTYRNDLFKDTCERLKATSEPAQAEVQRWIDEIGLNLQQNQTSAEAAADAPKLGAPRQALRAQIKKTEDLIKALDVPEPFLWYGTASDNPFDNPAIRRRKEEEHETRKRRQQELRAELEMSLLALRERDNPNWDIRGSPLTIHTMTEGTPASNFCADCVKLFEAYRPNRSSWKEEGDLYAVAANIYELITTRSIREKNADFSLEYHLKKAVRQFRNTRN